MVDTLAFLKNDYSAEEIHKIIDEVNSCVCLFGGYGATLLKTTNATVYRAKKEGVEVPNEEFVGKLSAKMLVIQQKLNSKSSSYDEYMKFLASSEGKELTEARNAIADKYLREHDGYDIIEYAPNKYVINARLNSGAYKSLANLLENMGIEYSDIVQWWSNEFDENTAFEFIDYEPQMFEQCRFNFGFSETYSDAEIENIEKNINKALGKIRYGLYSVDTHDFLRASSDTVVKVPILDEYRKLLEFRNGVLKDVEKKAKDSGHQIDNWSEIENLLNNETDTYCKTHHVFDEAKVMQGKTVLQIHIIIEDLEKVKSIIESFGYSLAFCGLNGYKSLSTDSFESVNISN